MHNSGYATESDKFKENSFEKSAPTKVLPPWAGA